jgi:hypothetical protein
MAVWRVVLRPEAGFGTALRPYEIGGPSSSPMTCPVLRDIETPLRSGSRGHSSAHSGSGGCVRPGI